MVHQTVIVFSGITCRNSKCSGSFKMAAMTTIIAVVVSAITCIVIGEGGVHSQHVVIDDTTGTCGAAHDESIQQ